MINPMNVRRHFRLLVKLQSIFNGKYWKGLKRPTKLTRKNCKNDQSLNKYCFWVAAGIVIAYKQCIMGCRRGKVLVTKKGPVNQPIRAPPTRLSREIHCINLAHSSNNLGSLVIRKNAWGA